MVIAFTAFQCISLCVCLCVHAMHCKGHGLSSNKSQSVYTLQSALLPHRPTQSYTHLSAHARTHTHTITHHDTYILHFIFWSYSQWPHQRPAFKKCIHEAGAFFMGINVCVCVCVRVFLWLCGQLFGENHCCDDVLSGPHNFKGLFQD